MGLMIGGYTLSAQSNVQAKQLMAGAERSVYGSASSEASFSSSYYTSKGKLQSQVQGKLFLQGESFRLEYGDIVAVFDGKTLSHYNQDEETLTYSTPTEEELLQINPLYFLRSGAKGFAIRSLSSKGGTATYAYTPQAKSNIKALHIAYRLSDSLPQSLVILGKDGGRIDIVLTQLKPSSKSYPRSKFVLDKASFPKTEVVDLR